MHATIFALLAGTRVLALDMNDRTGGCKTKLGELMKQAGLDCWCLHQEDVDAGEATRRLEILLATELDHSLAQQFIKRVFTRGASGVRVRQYENTHR
jgi:polysaccharide pyruvyl transferase WcaK-like protein